MYASYLKEDKLSWIYGMRFDPLSFTVSIDISLRAVGMIMEYFNRFKEGVDEMVKIRGYENAVFVLDRTKQNFGYESVGNLCFEKKFLSITFPLRPSGEANDDARRKHSFKLADTFSFLLGGVRGYLLSQESPIPAAGEPLQLFEVETSNGGGGYHGYALGGFVSQELRFFLHEQGDLPYSEQQKIRNDFRLEIEKLFGYQGEAKLVFESDGGFLVQVPGSACDIGVYGNEREKELEKAVEFESHNVDAPQQQLGLLVGLAMILDLYYKKHPEDIYWNK